METFALAPMPSCSTNVAETLASHGFVGPRKRVGLDEHRTPLSLNHVNHGEEKQENHQEAVSLRQPNATSHTMAWMKWFFTFTP